MKKLTKKLSLDEVLTGGVNLATNIAEEAISRTAVAVNKNMDKITNTAKWGVAYIGLNILDEHIDNFVADSILDIAQGITGTATIIKGYNTTKSLIKDYKNATDDEVAEIKELLGLEDTEDK